jgi:NADPH-dependent 2,4-dienoyl-CoA reductase/sulfur reductase-like enzyme
VVYKSLLTEVDGPNRVATFKNLDSGEITKKDFDFLHLAPPSSAPEFVRKSVLAAENGWLDVNIKTLQHNKFPNVYGLGDVCNLPTAKTAAAIFSQTPVVVNNILVDMKLAKNIGEYSGYSSCPLFVGDGKLMLIEFKYGAVADETFFADQTVPRKLFHFMKKEVFPRGYLNIMPKGNWFGRAVFQPKF